MWSFWSPPAASAKLTSVQMQQEFCEIGILAECSLGIFLGKEENRFCHGQKTSHASYSRLAVFNLTCPQCVAKQEMMSVFITTQPYTTLSYSSLWKRRTLQLLAAVSQSWHLCGCTDRPHKTAPMLTLCDSWRGHWSVEVSQFKCKWCGGEAGNLLIPLYLI